MPVEAASSNVPPTNTTVSSHSDIRTDDWDKADVPPPYPTDTGSKARKAPSTDRETPAAPYTTDTYAHYTDRNTAPMTLASGPLEAASSRTLLVVSIEIKREPRWDTVLLDDPVESPHDTARSPISDYT